MAGSTNEFRELPCIRLMGMPLHAVAQTQAVQFIVAQAAGGRGGRVITPNLDQLRLYRRHPELRAMYEDAGLVLADGMPLVWASRIAKTPLPERVAGSTLLLTLSEAAAENGLSIFLLGGNAGVAELAGKELVRRFPALQMAGTYFPPFGFGSRKRDRSNYEIGAENGTGPIMKLDLSRFPDRRLPSRPRLIQCGHIRNLHLLPPLAYIGNDGRPFCRICSAFRRFQIRPMHPKGIAPLLPRPLHHRRQYPSPSFKSIGNPSRMIPPQHPHQILSRTHRITIAPCHLEDSSPGIFPVDLDRRLSSAIFRSIKAPNPTCPSFSATGPASWPTSWAVLGVLSTAGGKLTQ